jgi:hypothetical protein
VSLGKDEDEFVNRVRDIDDILLERRGLRAFATACHNQFVSPKEILVRCLQGEWSGRLMGGLNELDNAIDASGFLRLTTVDRTTRLIGNVVGPPLREEARRFGIDVAGPSWSAGTPRRRSAIAQALVRGPFRRVLQGVYNRLFWLLSGQSSHWLERDPSGKREES